MAHTRSQSANTFQASPPSSLRLNSMEPPPATPSLNSYIYAKNDRNTVLNITLENGDAKTSLPPSDFESLDTTGRDKVSMCTLSLANERAPWLDRISYELSTTQGLLRTRMNKINFPTASKRLNFTTYRLYNRNVM